MTKVADAKRIFPSSVCVCVCVCVCEREREVVYIGLFITFVCWKMAPTRQRPLSKDILDARMKIMWEDQLVDPPIASITSVNVI